MNHKKCFLTAGFFFTSLLGTLSHFIYKWAGKNPIVGILAPINESTWEHMKMLFFPGLLYLLFPRRRLNGSNPGITAALSLGILTGTFMIPVIFYTYTGILGKHSLPLDVATFYVCVAAAFIIACPGSESEKVLIAEPLLILLLSLTAAAFVIFTFFPPGLGLFSAPGVHH